jgi:hypothetical protein
MMYQPLIQHFGEAEATKFFPMSAPFPMMMVSRLADYSTVFAAGTAPFTLNIPHRLTKALAVDFIETQSP